MNTSLLEAYFETVVLPLYGDVLRFAQIAWKDHGKVGADTWAHYFEDGHGREYVLVYEDFPGSEYLNDDLTHEIVPCGDQTSVQVLTKPESTVDNFIGYFTLYVERQG